MRLLPAPARTEQVGVKPVLTYRSRGAKRVLCVYATHSYVKIQMHLHQDHCMHTYANRNIHACLSIKKHLLLRHRATHPRTSCRRTVHMYCMCSLALSHPHTHKAIINSHMGGPSWIPLREMGHGALKSQTNTQRQSRMYVQSVPGLYVKLKAHKVGDR